MAQLSRSDPNQFEAWFSKLRFVGLEAGHLRITSPGQFVQRYIEAHLTRPLVAAVEAELGPVARISFV